MTGCGWCIPPSRYIDTAICKNIQHSLVQCEQGNYFRHLFKLYEAGEPGLRPEEHILFTQPGMRYCQALVHSLMKDETFMALEPGQRTFISERILEEVRGRMMEEMILLETAMVLGRNFSVFKLRFARGEFDMVIYDNKNITCAVYEIKHSDQCVPEQARHLMDDEKIRLTSRLVM